MSTEHRDAGVYDEAGRLMCFAARDETEAAKLLAENPWPAQSNDPLADLAAADLRAVAQMSCFIPTRPIIVPRRFAEEHGAALASLGAELVNPDGSPYEPPPKSEEEIAARVASYARGVEATTAQLLDVFTRLGIAVAP